MWDDVIRMWDDEHKYFQNKIWPNALKGESTIANQISMNFINQRDQNLKVSVARIVKLYVTVYK